MAIGLASLRAVDPVESDAFSAGVVQDFDGVAVEDGYDTAGEVCVGVWDKDYEEKKPRKWRKICMLRKYSQRELSGVPHLESSSIARAITACRKQYQKESD